MRLLAAETDSSIGPEQESPHPTKDMRDFEHWVFNNNDEILIKREPLVLLELGAQFREKRKRKKARTVQQTRQI